MSKATQIADLTVKVAKLDDRSRAFTPPHSTFNQQNTGRHTYTSS